MPRIKVLSPFGLRLNSEAPKRDFGIGEHNVSPDELAHWYTQACINEGMAVQLAEVEPGGAFPPAAPTKSQLMQLNREKLDELAAECGIAVPENTNKGDLAELLLVGQPGFALVKDAEGIRAQRAE